MECLERRGHLLNKARRNQAASFVHSAVDAGPNRAPEVSGNESQPVEGRQPNMRLDGDQEWALDTLHTASLTAAKFAA